MTDKQYKNLERTLEIAVTAIIGGAVLAFLLGVYALADLVL